MKKCYIELEVPDNFDPAADIEGVQFSEDVDLSETEVITCLDELPPVEIKPLTDDQAKKLEELCKVIIDEVSENSVIRVMVSPDYSELDAQLLQQLLNTVEATYKRPAIILVNSLELMVENPEASIDMLNKMIAKIKVRSAVKDTSGIVLPN